MERDLEKFERTLSVWIAALAGYDDQRWLRRPSDGGWNVAQVYAHIIDATNSFGFEKIAKCAERGDGRGRKTVAGRLVFLIGRIPPVRAKVPGDGSYAPREISRDDAGAELHALGARLREVVPVVRTARGVATHPFLGRLTAPEWLCFMEMHLRHHLRQKARLDREMRAQPERRG